MKKKIEYKTPLVNNLRELPKEIVEDKLTDCAKKPRPIDESFLPPGLRTNKVGDFVTIFDGGKEKTGKVVSVNNDGSLKIDFTEVKDIPLHWGSHRRGRN